MRYLRVTEGETRAPAGLEGECQVMTKMYKIISLTLLCLTPLAASAQSFRVQCPISTVTHPTAANNNSEPAYTGPTYTGTSGYPATPAHVNGAIKCQQISGGDGYATMGDGTQTYMFSFGPLSGLGDIANGQPGTEFPSVFNTVYPGATPLQPGDPATTGSSFTYNGAVGLAYDVDANLGSGTTGAPIDGHVDPRPIMDIGVMNGNIPAPMMAIDEDDEFFLTLTNVGMIMRPDLFEQHTVHFHGYPNASSYYDGVPDATWAINIGGSATYYYLAPDAGTYFWHCHSTPPEHLQMGMVGQLYVRPRQNRVTLGNGLYQSLVGCAGIVGCTGTANHPGQQSDLRTACNTSSRTNQDILCSTPVPQADSGFTQILDPFIGTDPRIPAGTRLKYAYNDGDGSTWYNVDIPLQIHGFDPNFHFVGMTFHPEGFADMKGNSFLLNGGSYPDPVGAQAIGTEDTDGRTRFSQPLPSLIALYQGERALLRLSDLDVTEYQTLAWLGSPMQLVGFQAKLLRDQAGNNLPMTTNSVTLGGGESLDVILDSCLVRSTTVVAGSVPACTTPVPKGTYFLYTPNLDHLSNDAENFGGLMTEVVVQ